MRSTLLTAAAIALLGLVPARAEDPLKSAPKSYRDGLMEAMKAFTLRDFAKAKAEVEKADAAYKPTTLSLNILGALAIEEKRFDEGRALCEKALKIDPKFFPARFNLAEIPFVQRKYTEAREILEKLAKEEPKNDLLTFRIFLTYLLEGNDREARARLEAIPLVNDTPISFYANAAWEFAHKNQDKGREWIASALRSFPPVKQVNFVEVFYDLGWLSREGYAPKEAPAAKPAQ